MLHSIRVTVFVGLTLLLTLVCAAEESAQEQERARRKEAWDPNPEHRVNIQPDIFDSEGVDVPLKLVFNYPKVVQINQLVSLRATVSHTLPITLRDVRFRVKFPSQVRVVAGDTSWAGSLSNKDIGEISTVARFPLVGNYEVQYVIDGLTDEGRFSQESRIMIEVKK